MKIEQLTHELAILYLSHLEELSTVPGGVVDQYDYAYNEIFERLKNSDKDFKILNV